MKSNFLSAAAKSGFIAGLIFLILEMIMVPLFLNGSPWGPPRMIAAIILGENVLPPPASFDLTIVMVALILHFILSIVYALIIGLFVSKANATIAVIVGIGAGLLIYFVNFYRFTSQFPWFAMARNWVSIFAHAVFGLSAALAFKAFYKSIDMRFAE